MKAERFSSSVAVLVIGLFLASAQALSQETVFNVPTTDVLDKGKVYFELDVTAKPNDSDAVNRFSSFVPRVVVGAGSGIEVGVNITGNIQPGPDATAIAPAIKWKAYDGKDNGWAVVFGDNLFIPVHNKTYNFGTYAYTLAQKTFKKGTRVGFGAFVFSHDVVAPGANRGGGQFTFEQPVTKRININADWLTGNHSSGYFTTGTVIKLTKKMVGGVAYSIGNARASQGNHFFYLEFGYNFN